MSSNRERLTDELEALLKKQKEAASGGEFDAIVRTDMADWFNENSDTILNLLKYGEDADLDDWVGDEEWFVIEIDKHIYNSGLSDPPTEQIMTTRLSAQPNWDQAVARYKNWEITHNTGDGLESRRMVFRNGDSETTISIREANDAELQG